MGPPAPRRSAEWAELHRYFTRDRDPHDPVGELLRQEQARAERLLNRVRAVMLLALAVGAAIYSPRITAGLSVVNAAVLAPLLAWTIGQYLFYHRRRAHRLPPYFGAINATIDVTALTLLLAGYGLIGTPELAVRSPIFLAYFAVLASRPFTGSARQAAAVTLLAVTAYATLAIGLIASGRLVVVASPLATVSGPGTSLLDEGAKLVLLATVGAIATYATAWNERALRRALAAQVAREAEARDVATRLQEADKLAAVGTLAAATVHEVRNPLAAIALQAELLLETPLTDEQRSDVTSIAGDARRTGAFLNDLLRVARSAGTGDSQAGPVSLATVVDSALATARPLLREQHVTVDLSANGQPLPAIQGSAQRLERAVLNLVMNAVQAMEGQARPKIIRLRVRTESANGSGPVALILDVEDTGPGFPPGAEAQAFDRFFTTKPAGRGTGLGLWIVRETAAEFGGTASTDRGADGGAVVRLRFPIA